MRKPLGIRSVIATLGLLTASLFSQQAAFPEIADLQAKYDERVRLDVLGPHDLAVADLNTKFGSALDRALEAAQKAGALDEAIAIKREKEAVLSGKYSPAADDPKTSASLKTLHVTYRSALAKLELERDKQLRPLKDKFARSLDAVIVAMTKNGKLEEAMALKKIRDDLLASSGEVAATSSSKAASMSGDGKMIVNSLGMKFVVIPGTKVLMCIHETRYKDYTAYAAETANVNDGWKNQMHYGFALTDRPEDHPVVNTNWDDAKGFCAWLSKKEGKTYRLPTDEEWSYAVGIGREENWRHDTTPATVFKNPTEFPWGDKYPPPDNSGNYSDESRKEKQPSEAIVDGYTDGFATTAPVMSYKPNKLGLYDLNGNVFEWCEDWFDSTKTDRVLRGADWGGYGLHFLLSSTRGHFKPDYRHIYHGFRCVIESAR